MRGNKREKRGEKLQYMIREGCRQTMDRNQGDRWGWGVMQGEKESPRIHKFNKRSPIHKGLVIASLRHSSRHREISLISGTDVLEKTLQFVFEGAPLLFLGIVSQSAICLLGSTRRRKSTDLS